MDWLSKLGILSRLGTSKEDQKKKKKKGSEGVGGPNLGYTLKGFEKRRKDYDTAFDWQERPTDN